MKTKIPLSVLTAFLFLSMNLSGQGITITLLHVNDTHSHLDAVGPKDASLEGTLGGMAKAATVIGTLRATEPNVLLLHAGDVFQGDPMFNTYFGVPEFQLMKELGFDAMAVGNHEFDFGPEVLNDVLTTAFAGGSFPLLSANLDMSAFPDLQNWIQPSMMKNIAGVKIGIFGMTVPNNPTNMPAPVIVSDDLINIAQQTATSLRTNGADVVIFLSHLGVFYDKMVAENTTGINFIIGGHDHYLFEQPVYVNNPGGTPVPIFQAGEHYKYIGKLHFTVNNNVVTMNDYAIVNVDEAVTAEPAIHSLVETLKSGVIAQFGDLYYTVIGTAVNDLNEQYKTTSPSHDTPLGNLVTDAFKEKTGTDIAITPLGLISEKIYTGPIVGADVFRSLSYGYDEATGLGLQLATFDMTGYELVHGMEVGLSQLEVGDDFFLQFSGVRFRYDPSKPAGERVILNSIRVNGKKLVPEKIYSVTVNTGVIMLLDMVGVAVSNIQVLPDFEMNVVRDYIANLGRLNYHAQGRIREDQSNNERNAFADVNDIEPVHDFSLSGNYPNPVTTSTTIEFNISEKSPVTLKIFDVVGNEVAILVNGTYEPGIYRIPWLVNKIPPGVYYYQLDAGDFSDTKKMMILK